MNGAPVAPYYGPVRSPGYLRFPHVTNETVVFVAADDVWLAPLTGGRAWRFTADEAQAATPRLSPDGTQVTVDSPAAVAGLQFLVDGVRQGWIPTADLGYEEVSAQQAFESGKFLFLNDWPDVYAAASQPGPGNRVVGKFGVAAYPSRWYFGATLVASACSCAQVAGGFW